MKPKASLKWMFLKPIVICLIGGSIFGVILMSCANFFDKRKQAQGVVTIASSDGVTIMRVYDRAERRWIYFTNKGEIMPQRTGKYSR